MKLTLDQIKANDDIPTEEVEQDIRDTQREIIDFQDELSVLSRNRQENRTRIYFLQGNIAQRQEFVEKLGQILEYRQFGKIG